LPPKSGKRLASLVPFALEDQVAARSTRCTSPVGTQEESGAVETAIVDREQLAATLASLAEQGLVPVAAYGAPQLTPVTPNTLTIVTDGAHDERAPPGWGRLLHGTHGRPTGSRITHAR
jgi:type II secretory pathway component PulL